MCLSPQPAQAARGVDGADVGPDRLEQGQGAALGLDLAQDVLAHAGAQVGRGAREPAAPLMQQVGRDALRLLLQVGLVRAGLLERVDGLVDLVALDRRGRLEPLGGRELAAGGLLRLQELAE